MMFSLCESATEKMKMLVVWILAAAVLLQISAAQLVERGNKSKCYLLCINIAHLEKKYNEKLNCMFYFFAYLPQVK